MTFEAFIGQSYSSPSVAWDLQRTMNLYQEADESGGGKSAVALFGTPGLTALQTLATSRVRGIWTGLADNLPGSTAVDACYLVAGSKLIQITGSGATNAVLGDVGDDATHSPVTFQVNGTQILITSAGLAWVWDGFTLSRPYFNNGMGTVNTVGTAVTWASGDPFDASLVGSGFVIGSTAYVISAYIDPTHITLASSAGTQSGAAYRVMAAAGTVDIPGGGTPIVNWSGGDQFDKILSGNPIQIGGSIYIVNSIISPTQLTVAATTFPAPLFGLTYSSDMLVPAAMSAFLDTYGIILPPNSKTFYISESNNFKVWNPLDFGRKSAFPDNIASIFTDHEELWLSGSETTEVWRNTGSSDFPLERDPSAFIAEGCRAPFTFVALGGGVAWVGGDTRGNPIAYRATGYQPVRVSTHGVETAWASYSTITDATGFVYVVRGHEFWVLTFPTANATWVYDATAAKWHERGWWNGSGFDRTRYATHGYCFGKHLVGDWSSGKLYALDEAVFTDDGTAIHRVRTCPHLSEEDLWTFYAGFRLSCQTGLTPTLSWSDDSSSGTPTWHTEVPASNRLLGGVSQNSAWRRLGKARDRVWRITITDAAQVALFAAYLDIGQGSG